MGGALPAAADGMRIAEERLRHGAGNLSRGLEATPAMQLATDVLAEAESRVKQSDALRDIVELSEAAAALKANAGVFRAAGGTSQEVVNLGRRLDVKA
jgi:hypothetical protein